MYNGFDFPPLEKTVQLNLPDIIIEECPGATVETFADTESILIKWRHRNILLAASTIELGEAAIRARLRSLVPRYVKPTRGRKKKVVLSLEQGETNGTK